MTTPQTFDQWYASEPTRIWSRRYLAHRAWHAALEQRKPAKLPRRKHLHIDHLKAAVLDAVTTFSPDGIGIGELAAQLDLSATSVYRALYLLRDEGKVRKSVRRWII
jgi:DNA-binding transcriptional ArsR family regulator